MALARALFVFKTDVVEKYDALIRGTEEKIPDGVGYCKKQYDAKLPTQYVEIVSPAMEDLKKAAEKSDEFEFICNLELPPHMEKSIVALPFLAVGNRRLFLAAVGLALIGDKLLGQQARNEAPLTTERKERIATFLSGRGWKAEDLTILTSNIQSKPDFTDVQCGYCVAKVHKWSDSLLKEYKLRL